MDDEDRIILFNLIIDAFDYIETNGFMNFIKCVLINVTRIMLVFIGFLIFICAYHAIFVDIKHQLLLGTLYVIYGCICGISSYYIRTNNIYKSFKIMAINVLLFKASFYIESYIK
jgi:hypothetical protein